MYLGPFSHRQKRRPTNIFPKQLIAARQFLQDIEKGLPLIGHKPALVLWGDSDFAFKEKERQRFRTAFPDHRDIDLPGAGHFVQEDAPDEISTAIADWYDLEAAHPNAVSGISTSPQ